MQSDDGWNDFTSFLNGYLEGILFTAIDIDSGEPLDKHFSVEQFTTSLCVRAATDAAKFYIDNHKAISELIGMVPGYDYRLAGIDFNYCRNGHGTGFWERADTAPAQHAADALSDAARAFGAFNVDTSPTEGGYGRGFIVEV